MPPIPTEWWLRPVSIACLVGEHSAVVWNRLYLSPLAARRSAVGVFTAPPNALDAAKPTSSSNTISTFGAPSGGRSGVIGGKDVSGSFASYVTSPSNARSGIGRVSRPVGSGMPARSQTVERVTTASTCLFGVVRAYLAPARAAVVGSL